jgi:hypothetical protein
MMHKGDAVTWPEARPFYMQRFNGWIKDGEPHDLIKMLDRLQEQLEAARDHYAPKLSEEDVHKVIAEAVYTTAPQREAIIDALRAAGVRLAEEA